MEKILKDINSVVGVTGSFVCDDEGQVVAKLLPAIFDDMMLSPVGRTMAQTMAGLKLARRRKVSDLDIVYREGRLVVKNLREGYLCILCMPTINIPLLNLTANVAARKLAKQIRGEQAAQTEVPSPQKIQEAAGPTVDDAFFSRVEQALTRLMGPMATFVLEEHVTALGDPREAFPLDKAHQLVEKLAAEIEDENKKDEFKQIALEALDQIA